MLKKSSAQSQRALGVGTLAALLLTPLTPLPALCQQSSPVVTSNIELSNDSQGKKMPQLTPLGVIAVPEGFAKLKLSPGYLLEMNIYNIPEMTSELRIDAQGFVAIPLVGAIQIEGDTLPQAQNAIAKVLVAKEILKDPQVTLNILEFSAKNISVLGEVQNPGRIQLLAPEPLQDVLALAGGETIQAGNDIEIEHPTDNGTLNVRHVEYAQGTNSAPLQNITIQPGDTVLVHRAGIIYVLGAVNRPGGYLMVHGGSLNVLEAVSLAGGVSLQAATKWAVVVRRQGAGIVQIKVPLAKMETGKANSFQLQLNDALYVPISTWKAVLINGSSVLSAATSAAIYRAP